MKRSRRKRTPFQRLPLFPNVEGESHDYGSAFDVESGLAADLQQRGTTGKVVNDEHAGFAAATIF